MGQGNLVKHVGPFRTSVPSGDPISPDFFRQVRILLRSFFQSVPKSPVPVGKDLCFFDQVRGANLGYVFVLPVSHGESRRQGTGRYFGREFSRSLFFLEFQQWG